MATNPVSLSRKQVAALLGISDVDVQTKDGEVFHPTKGPDGSWRYPPGEVAFALRGAAPAGEGGLRVGGAACASAFRMFQEGKSLVEVVVGLQQAPENVRLLRAEYDAMTKMVTMPAPVVAALEKAIGRSVESGEQLVSALADLPARVDVAYARGYESGLADANDFGAVVEPTTGKRRAITRSDAETALRATRSRREGGTQGGPSQKS
jgi:hypothetical protein